MMLTYDINNQVNLEQAFKVWEKLRNLPRYPSDWISFGGFVDWLNNEKGECHQDILCEIEAKSARLNEKRFPNFN